MSCSQQSKDSEKKRERGAHVDEFENEAGDRVGATVVATEVKGRRERCEVASARTSKVHLQIQVASFSMSQLVFLRDCERELCCCTGTLQLPDLLVVAPLNQRSLQLMHACSLLVSIWTRRCNLYVLMYILFSICECTTSRNEPCFSRNEMALKTGTDTFAMADRGPSVVLSVRGAASREEWQHSYSHIRSKIDTHHIAGSQETTTTTIIIAAAVEPVHCGRDCESAAEEAAVMQFTHSFRSWGEAATNSTMSSSAAELTR